MLSDTVDHTIFENPCPVLTSDSQNSRTLPISYGSLLHTLHHSKSQEHVKAIIE